MKMKKVLSLLLAAVMLLGLLPMTALAAEGEDNRTVPVSSTPELESITLSVFVVGVDQVGRNIDGEIDKEAHTITFTLPEGVEKDSEDTVLTLASSSPEALLIEMDEAGYFELDYKQDQVLTIGGVEYTVTVKEAEIFNPFTGSGTENDPYIIPDATALTWLSERYNAVPSAFFNKYWKQTASIDMSGIEFIPIGSTYDNRFIGTYDGCGYPISNLNITFSEESAGLFGFVGDAATIKNIILDSTCSVVSRASSVGGIVGSMSKDGASIVENCTNYAPVTGNYGIEGGFSSTSGNVGGIVGSSVQPNGAIIGCKNYGNVRVGAAAIHNAGGIVGSAHSTTVIDCHNYGNVTAPSAESWSGAGNGSRAGGITAISQGTVAGCSNCGAVTAGSSIGGITGSANQGIIEGCYNTGEIAGNSAIVNPCAIGGIAGQFGGSYLGDCYNTGEISAPNGVATLYSGAIIGQASSSVTRAITKNFFVGTRAEEAFGTVYLTSAEATALSSAELKSTATVTALNDYPEPWSLYKTTWAEDSGTHTVAERGYKTYLGVTPDDTLNEEFPLYFADGVDDLPYVDIGDWVDLMNFYHTDAGDAGYELKIDADNDVVTLTRENGYTATLDYENDKIVFSDYDAFMHGSDDSTLIDIVSEKSTDDNGRPLLIMRDTKSSFDRYGDMLTIDLSAYDIHAND